MSSKHPGFKAVQSQIAGKEGVSRERAGAILASATRNASPAAKKANPHLKNVRGSKSAAAEVTRRLNAKDKR